MKLIRYKVVIDSDVIKDYNIHIPVQIGYYIGIYLNDPDGWSKHGYFFEPVDENENVHIRLSSPNTIKKICGLPGNLSCAETRWPVRISEFKRWFNGATASKLSLEDYRQKWCLMKWTYTWV